MSHPRNHTVLGFHSKLRAARIRDRNLRRQELSRQRESVIQQRRAARIAWLQRTFRSPLVACDWVFTQATSLWSAFLYLLGLQPKTGLKKVMRNDANVEQLSSIVQALREGTEQLSDGLKFGNRFFEKFEFFGPLSVCSNVVGSSNVGFF